MPVYRYKASDLDGKTVRGEMQAVSEPALREQLLQKELYLAVCSERGGEEKAGKKLNARQLSEFCRELGTMLGAGVPLVRALNIMAKRDIPEKVKDVYVRLYRSLKQGSMLSEAMEEQGTFPELLVSMYKASEASGQMEQTCAKMAEHYEKSYRLKKKVSSAMFYPALLVVVTVGVLLIVFLVILPTFFQLFADMNAELPGITQFMLNVSVGLKNNWLYLLIGVLVLVLAGRLLLRVPAVRLARDRMRLRIPVVGKLLKIIYTARFARTLSSCYASGISIIASLRNARDTVGNDYIASQFDGVLNEVRSGKSLSAAIKRVDGFDSKLSASIQIGEETGKLYDMLENMADAFDYDADTALARLVAMIEPVMIIVMALIIGTVIISVMLPLTSLYDAIGASA